MNCSSSTSYFPPKFDDLEKKIGKIRVGQYFVDSEPITNSPYKIMSKSRHVNQKDLDNVLYLKNIWKHTNAKGCMHR